MEIDLDALPDDADALRAIIVAQHQALTGMQASNRAYEALVQALKITIARLKKQRFGSSSEKIEREIQQLEFALEELEGARAAADATPEAEDGGADDDAPAASAERAPQRRRGKPRIAPDAPREIITLDPGERCPDCGGVLRLVGEDGEKDQRAFQWKDRPTNEILDFIAAKLKVVEVHRPRKSCRDCERMVQTPAPPRPIPRGMAGPALLAHILIAKYDDQLPLYRQGEIFARMGADIPRSTLIDWCGQAAAALRPVAEHIRASVLAGDRLHADDTPIRALDPRKKRLEGLDRGVKEGRIWVYVRDDRPWGGSDPPAAAYCFSPDRKGEHPRAHLADFAGILQADAYSGFRELYARGADGAARVREAACWAHLRRDFHDVWKGTDSPIAREALERIGRLYDIEKRINGRPAEERLAVRRKESKPVAEAFEAWCRRQLEIIPGKGDLAKAMRYALNRWPSFTRPPGLRTPSVAPPARPIAARPAPEVLEDGRVALDNNAAERALKPVVLGRKNFLFAGSDAGGEILADAMTVIETAKLSGLDPEAYLADLLGRIRQCAPDHLDDLLPWAWTPAAAETLAA